MKSKSLIVLDQEINVNKNDYFSLTDIAKFKNPNEANDVSRKKKRYWFLGLWEKLNNPNFKPTEFDGFKTESGHNYFTMSPGL